MNKRILIPLVPILVLSSLLASAALAQSEQWLQYRSANEARQIVAGMGYQQLQPSYNRPDGPKLPEFKSDRPVFVEWKTPMVPSGRIWMAFDKSKPNSSYDRLYLDANANGDLSDDPVCQPYQRNSDETSFGPVKVVFQASDGPITYHLNLQLYVSSERTRCLVSPGGWYEGQITVGGVKKRCTLIDRNVNGAFNDKSSNYDQADGIRIGEQSNPEADGVGNYIEVDNKLYKLEVARDGACVTLTEAKDVPQGIVRLADNIANVIVHGENGSFVRKPEQGVIKLPAGEYAVTSWALARKDDTGARWEMKALLYPGEGRGGFTAAQDKESSLLIGEPIYSKVEVNKSGSTYSFTQRLEGRQGERISLTRNGSQPPAPKMRIRSRDGTFDRSLTSEYG